MYIRTTKEIAQFFNVPEDEVTDLLQKYELKSVAPNRFITEQLWKILLAGLDSNGDLDEIFNKWEEIKQKRYRTQITEGLKNKIIARDKNKCRYCGKNLNKNNRVIDHVLPWSKGGRNTEDNLVLSCRACNSQKSNKLLEDTEMALLPIPE